MDPEHAFQVPEMRHRRGSRHATLPLPQVTSSRYMPSKQQWDDRFSLLLAHDASTTVRYIALARLLQLAAVDCPRYMVASCDKILADDEVPTQVHRNEGARWPACLCSSVARDYLCRYLTFLLASCRTAEVGYLLWSLTQTASRGKVLSRAFINWQNTN